MKLGDKNAGMTKTARGNDIYFSKQSILSKKSIKKRHYPLLTLLAMTFLFLQKQFYCNVQVFVFESTVTVAVEPEIVAERVFVSETASSGKSEFVSVHDVFPAATAAFILLFITSIASSSLVDFVTVKDTVLPDEKLPDQVPAVSSKSR